MTDVVVTSSNARQIVESFPSDEKIIFGPDRNLGNYINSVTGRNMLLWDGACHVHEKFSVEKILELKESHPRPRCWLIRNVRGSVETWRMVGSTAALLKYAIRHEGKEFIVATESGILHEMQKACPEKTFIPAPPDDNTCACNECNYMRLITLEKLYNTLKYEWPEIVVDAEVAGKGCQTDSQNVGNLREVRIVMKRLKTFTDERGSLAVAETGKDLPFEVKRAYWIYGVPEGHERGKHANRITYQYLVAVKGA